MPMPLSLQEKSIHTDSSPAAVFSPARCKSSTQISPPSCVYFTAFPMILTAICRSRKGSPNRRSLSICPIAICRLWFFCCACGRTITAISCTKSASEKASSLIAIRPLSIRDISSTSFTRLIKCVDAVCIFKRQSCTLAFSSIWDNPMEAIPRIAFIGVRISWDILDKKALFALFAASAASSACVSFALTCSSFFASPSFSNS